MTDSLQISSAARRVHEEAILVDGQGVTVLLPVAQIVPAVIDGVSYLDRAIAGGVSAQNVTLGIVGIGMGVDDFRALLGTIHGHYCYFEIEPRLLLVETADDIRRANREGKGSSSASKASRPRSRMIHPSFASCTASGCAPAR